MKPICLCLGMLLAAGAAFAGSESSGEERGRVSDEEIRSGMIIDDGLELPHIRPGTQYFEINGSRRIARALGEDRLPTDLASGLSPDPEPDPEPLPGHGPGGTPMPEPMIDLPSGPGLPDDGAAPPVQQAATW